MKLFPNILLFLAVACLAAVVAVFTKQESHDHDHDGHCNTKKTTTKSTVRTSTKPAPTTTTTAKPTTAKTTTSEKTAATTTTSKPTSFKTTTAKPTTSITSKTTTTKPVTSTTTIKPSTSTTFRMTSTKPATTTTTAKLTTSVKTTAGTTRSSKTTTAFKPPTTSRTTSGPSTTTVKKSTVFSTATTETTRPTAITTSTKEQTTSATTPVATTEATPQSTSFPTNLATSTATTSSTAEADTTSTVSSTSSSPSSFVTSTTPSTTTATSIPSTTPSEDASSSTLWTTTTTTPSPVLFDCSVGDPDCGTMCTNATSSGTGVVQSPNFPGDYGNESRFCEVSITAPAGWMIQLKFTTFNLETNKAYVNVGDDYYSAFLLSDTTGNTIPTIVPATINRMYIVFRTDVRTKPSTAVYNWRATFSVTSQGSSCSVDRPACGTMCAIVTSSGSGVVQSPDFPADYGNYSRDCYVSIVVPAGKRIRLAFTTFNVETGTGFVSVAERSTILLDTVTGSAIPPVVISTSNIMYIVFGTYDSTKPTTATYKWQATYTAVTADATSTTPRLTTTKPTTIK